MPYLPYCLASYCAFDYNAKNCIIPMTVILTIPTCYQGEASMKKLKWETPTLIDLSKIANGDPYCENGSGAPEDCTSAVLAAL